MCIHLCVYFKDTNGQISALQRIHICMAKKGQKEMGSGGKDAGQGAWVKCILMQMSSTLVTR